MPWLDRSDRSSSHAVAIPDCPRCYKTVSVSEVKLQGLPVPQGIQDLALSSVRFCVGDD